MNEDSADEKRSIKPRWSFDFKVNTVKRLFTLYAPSADERKLWVHTFCWIVVRNQALKKKKEQDVQNSSRPSSGALKKQDSMSKRRDSSRNGRKKEVEMLIKNRASSQGSEIGSQRQNIFDQGEEKSDVGNKRYV